MGKFQNFDGFLTLRHLKEHTENRKLIDIERKIDKSLQIF